jgi:bacteriocin-like protein
MQLINDNELDQISGGFYNEILIATAALTLGYLCYEAWKLSPNDRDLASDAHHDAYYEGAMQFLGTGGHCA